MSIKTKMMKMKNSTKELTTKHKRAALVSVLASALVMGGTGAAFAHDDDGDGHRDGDKREGHSSVATVKYTGPVETTTIAEVKANTSWFTDVDYILEGHVTKQLSNRTFLFSDGVDELIIKLRSTQTPSFSDKDSVRIKGQYETEFFSDDTFEVKQITLL